MYLLDVEEYSSLNRSIAHVLNSVNVRNRDKWATQQKHIGNDSIIGKSAKFIVMMFSFLFLCITVSHSARTFVNGNFVVVSSSFIHPFACGHYNVVMLNVDSIKWLSCVDDSLHFERERERLIIIFDFFSPSSSSDSFPREH